jgi:hypothetical protein
MPNKPRHGKPAGILMIDKSKVHEPDIDPMTLPEMITCAGVLWRKVVVHNGYTTIYVRPTDSRFGIWVCSADGSTHYGYHVTNLKNEQCLNCEPLPSFGQAVYLLNSYEERHQTKKESSGEQTLRSPRKTQ